MHPERATCKFSYILEAFKQWLHVRKNNTNLKVYSLVCKHMLLRLGCSSKHMHPYGNKCMCYFCFHLTWVVHHHVGKCKGRTWEQLQLCSSQFSGAIALAHPWGAVLWSRRGMNEEHAVSAEKLTQLPLVLLYFLPPLLPVGILFCKTCSVWYLSESSYLELLGLYGYDAFIIQG